MFCASEFNFEKRRKLESRYTRHILPLYNQLQQHSAPLSEVWLHIVQLVTAGNLQLGGWDNFRLVRTGRSLQGAFAQTVISEFHHNQSPPKIWARSFSPACRPPTTPQTGLGNITLSNRGFYCQTAGDSWTLLWLVAEQQALYQPLFTIQSLHFLPYFKVFLQDFGYVSSTRHLPPSHPVVNPGWGTAPL